VGLVSEIFQSTTCLKLTLSLLRIDDCLDFRQSVENVFEGGCITENYFFSHLRIILFQVREPRLWRNKSKRTGNCLFKLRPGTCEKDRLVLCDSPKQVRPLRDELLEREAFDTLLEANGAIRAVAAALPHDPATQFLGLPAAQCLGLPDPGAEGVAAPCVRLEYASANARGWSIGGQNPNLRTGVIHGGRWCRVTAR
jgi:hypothetical protein